MEHTKHNAASLLSRKTKPQKKQTNKLTTLISHFAHCNCSFITTMRYVVHTAHNIYTGSNSTQNVGGYDFKTSIQNRLKIPVLRSRGVGLRWEGAGEVPVNDGLPHIFTITKTITSQSHTCSCPCTDWFTLPDQSCRFNRCPGTMRFSVCVSTQSSRDV